jgi:hypothetical protein
MAQQTATDPLSTPALGIIMLNTRFPRVVGDIGNPATFPFPVRYRIVEAATVAHVVRADGLSAGLVDGFVEAAHQLAAEGVSSTARGLPWARRRRSRPCCPAPSSRAAPSLWSSPGRCP